MRLKDSGTRAKPMRISASAMFNLCEDPTGEIPAERGFDPDYRPLRVWTDICVNVEEALE